VVTQGRTKNKKRVASVVTAGVALELAALMGFTYATGNAPSISLLAATSIFIDGTQDILPTTDPQGIERMKDTLMGAFDLEAGLGPVGVNKFIEYPRSFGILTNGVGYDESKDVASQKTYDAIKAAIAANPGGTPIYVIGYSQGANAASDVLKRLEEEGFTDRTDDITFVLLGNPARNDGGVMARLPLGVFVPLIGLTFGASTNPSTDLNAPQVIQISKQYDAASDVPTYVLNPFAWANTALGFFYVHNGYYQDVDLDLDDDGDVDQDDVVLAEASPDYIVTRNGNITDIVIKNKPGDLPLLRPLRDLGVPDELLDALEPFFRTMIEAGYERPPDGGEYPDEPVQFRLLPGLGDLDEVDLLQTNQTQTLRAAAPAGPDIIPPPANATVAQPRKFWTPPSWTPPSWTPPSWTPPPPPPVVEEEPEELAIEEETPAPNSQRNVWRPPIGGSPAPPGAGLKAINTAINGVVTGVKKLLTPKPAGATSPPPSSAPDPEPGPDPSTDTDSGTTE
jgi:hypothetical protein